VSTQEVDPEKALSMARQVAASVLDDPSVFSALVDNLDDHRVAALLTDPGA
jgi:hypothetical protein